MMWGILKEKNGYGSHGQSKFDTSSRLDGKLMGSETIVIEGLFDGEILVNGSLEITQNAEINANIKVNKLSIYGKVKGNIEVADSLLVGGTAVIHGDIKAGAVTIAAGAVIDGQCSFGGMSDNREKNRPYS